MKIAFITESFPETSETFILGKVVELKKRGHEVTVFTQFKRQHQVHPDLLAHIDLDQDVVKLPVWDRVRGKDFSRALIAAGPRSTRIARVAATAAAGGQADGKLLRFVKAIPFVRNDYDLVHAHYAYMGLRYLDAVAALDLPLIVSLLGTDASIDVPLNPERYLPLWEQAPCFIAVVEYLKHKVVEHGCDPAKIKVIPTETDLDHFCYHDRSDRQREQPVTLTVGRLDWTKGYLYALEAMAMLKQQKVNFQYRIVGAGKGRYEIEQAISDFDLHDRVKLLGVMDRQGVRDAMAEADVFVLASVIEGIGGVLLEAQATGLPVVATRVGGLPEVVKQAETGLLVPARDPEALAAAVRRLIEDRGQRLAMGKLASEWVSERFNKDQLTDDLIALYGDVVSDWSAR